jgi:hypothetical protein
LRAERSTLTETTQSSPFVVRATSEARAGRHWHPMNGVSGRINQASRYEDQEIELRALRDFGLEQATDQWQVTEKRDLVIDFGQLLSDQSRRLS